MCNETKKSVLYKEKIQKNQNCSEIAEALEEEVSYIQIIVEAVKRSGPEYDPEKILEEMKSDTTK